MKKEINVEPLFEFHSHSNWVNTASRQFKPYKFTPTICLDKNDNVCHIGEDFSLAKSFKTFPITVYRIIRFADIITKEYGN